LAALGVPGAADATALHRAAAGYRPLPSRLTPAGTVGGVRFVDDSLSTNVLPTLAALDAFPGRRIALIVGGHDRGIDYAPLAAGVVAREAPTYVLTLPDSGPRIRTQLEAATPAPTQRHETGNSVRSNAVKPGIQSVAEAAPAPQTGFAGVTDCPDLAA